MYKTKKKLWERIMDLKVISVATGIKNKANILSKIMSERLERVCIMIFEISMSYT